MPKIGDIKKGKNYSKYIWSACVDCGREKWIQLVKGRPKSIRCNSCAKKGKGNPNFGKHGKDSHCWKGERKRNGRGYVVVWIDTENPYYVMSHRNQIKEHRLVMARHLGRCLTPEEIVHHINGIKDDNRIENLELTTQPKHMKLYQKLEIENRKLKKKIEELEETIKTFNGG